jgi:hypothetical protein
MKKHTISSSLAVVTLSALMVHSIAFAAPPTNPPTANVDASFNSTSYPNTTSPTIIINAVTGIYSFVQATLAQLIVTGSTQLGDLSIAANGDVSKVDGGVIYLKDGAVIYPGGDSNDFNTSLFFNTGTLAGKTVPTIQTFDSTGAFTPTWLPYGLAVSTLGNAAGTALKIADDQGIQIANDAGMVGLSIAANGTISGTGASPIQINHTAGLQINNFSGLLGLKISGYGDISGPASGPVKITDNQGLQVANDAGTVGLSVSATGDISTTNGNVSVKNITASGPITSSGGFGKIYTATGTSVNISANTYGSAGSASCAKASDRVLSCSFSASSDVLLADTYPSASACSVYVKNVSAITRSVTPKVICIDSTGSPW